MTVTYQRTDGRGEPPEHERLEIADDGTFRLWRSTGTSAVGRFGGRLEADEAARLTELAATARGVPLADEQPPGSALELVDVGGGTVVSLGHGEVPEAPWGELVSLLRRLADARTDAPVAAIRLDIDPTGGDGAHLVHAGTEPIGVELDQLTIEAVAWKGYYDLAGKWQRGPLPVEADATAGPGWAVDLPFDHDLELGAGRTLHVRVTFALDDGGTVRRVLAAHVPAIPEPRRRR